jgi:hypothetical protein
LGASLSRQRGTRAWAWACRAPDPCHPAPPQPLSDVANPLPSPFPLDSPASPSHPPPPPAPLPPGPFPSSHPFCYFPTFYLLKGAVEGRPLASTYDAYRAELWDNCKALWKIWVPAQLLNFAVVPRHLRIPYGEAAALGGGRRPRARPPAPARARPRARPPARAPARAPAHARGPFPRAPCCPPASHLAHTRPPTTPLHPPTHTPAHFRPRGPQTQSLA